MSNMTRIWYSKIIGSLHNDSIAYIIGVAYRSVVVALHAGIEWYSATNKTLLVWGTNKFYWTGTL